MRINRTLNPTTAVGKIFYLTDGTIQSCNTSACEILGYSCEQLVGTCVNELPWQTSDERNSVFDYLVEIGQTARSGVAINFQKPNGAEIALSIDILPLCRADNSQLYGVEVNLRDVTNDTSELNRQDSSVGQVNTVEISNGKKRITIVESERRLKLATDASGIGMWFWDLADVIEWTELGKAIFGASADEEISFQKCLEIIHPEDRHLVKAGIDAALANKTQYSIEYRVVWSDGSVHWIAAKGRGVYNQEGKPVSMMGTVQDISERYATEQKLKDNQQLLQLALKNAKAGLWDWNFISQEIAWSPENYELYGIDPKLKPLRFQDWEHTLHPDDIAASNAEIQKVLAGETHEFATEFRIFHPQKGTRWILGVGDVIYDEEGQPIRLTGLNLDITSLKETEAAFQRSKQDLKQRERELELITEVIPQQIWTASTNGQIDYINHRSSNYTGLGLEQMQGWGWAELIHPEDLSAVKTSWLRSVRTGANFNVEVRLRNTEGIYRWFLAKARPLFNERKEITKWYGTNTNINRIKELEERLRKQTKDLIQANQLKDDFLAIVSHELRTPLNPILGWSQMLAGGKLNSARIAQGIGIIERNARLQAQLIDDLLDVSRILRGKLKLNKTPLDLERVVKSAISTVQLSAEAKSIAIETEFEPKIGQVLGDLSRLQQIIWNLISNAVKFTPPEGRILVRLRRANTQAIIEVKDTGKGIEPEFIPHVFDRFRQENSANTREFGGLGLGLAIVKYLTELHGGTVDVSSPGSDRGATFSVRLPLMNLSIPEPISFNSNQSVQPNRFNGLTVLVVDDEADSLDILTLILQSEGAEVISVASAKAALEVFTQTTPDLIISDIGMPYKDGYTLIEEIRQLPQGQNLPAIALTAYAAEIDMQHSFEAGFQKHLAKPVDIPQLIEAVTELL